MEIIVNVWRLEGGWGQTGSRYVTQAILKLRILGVKNHRYAPPHLAEAW